MYMILYWLDDDTVYPIVNSDCTIKVFYTLNETDSYVTDNFQFNSDAYRVISMGGVLE